MNKKPATPKKQAPVQKKEEPAAAAVAGAVAPVVAAPVKKGKGTPELLRGFRDILPEEQGWWDMARDAARRMARDYSFDRIDFPVVEDADLFVRAVGKTTDIVEKEIFSVHDPLGEQEGVLRPEGTAQAVRAYIGHGMLNLPQPVKMWYIGPMFRGERPQAGRFRQFNQFAFEVIGSPESIVDAQLMVIIHSYFKELGLDIVLQVNSIGTPESRNEYKVELVSYYRTHRNDICEDCKRRLQKNPLRLLDCKADQCQPIKAGAPQILDWIDEDSKQHFMMVLEYLDEVEVPYVLNPHLVRGLDYYSRTVFEVFPAGEETDRAQSALGAGGRYDGLVELLGGRPTPACGFALGMERIVSLLREKQVPVRDVVQPKVFFAQLGDAARRKGLKLFEEFRAAGIPVAEAFGKGALKAQLEMSNKLACPFTLILGQKEVIDGTVIIRDMESGAQEIADAGKIVAIVQKKLSGT